jgi:cysteine desulfurase
MSETTMTNSSNTAKRARPIYLDNHATTPLDPRVLDAMMPYFTEKFGNPHSVSHLYGYEAEEGVELARDQIAAVIGAEPREIVFTSGATESNNLAIRGAAAFQAQRRRHVITAVTEHKCVLESVRQIEREGFRVTWLPVGKTGHVNLDELAAAISDDTLLVSIMAVNNEIGSIEPLNEIGALCRAKGVYFHTDAAQAFGKIPLDVNTMSIDLMSISGHKIYGPKGIGALYVRRRPRVRIAALMAGGGQERGHRSGTLPTPLCVGFGKAAEIAAREMPAEAARLAALRDRLRDGILTRLSGVRVNGDPAATVPGNLNLSFSGVDAAALMAALHGVALSSGSACTSAVSEPSHVLRALGLSDDEARASLRFGVGRFNTEAEIDSVIDAIVAAVTDLRRQGAASSSLNPSRAAE